MAQIRQGYYDIETKKAGRGIFKPHKLFDEDLGYQTVPYNEALAYMISDLFIFDLVPETVLTKVKIGEEVMEGSVQTYVEGVPLDLYLRDNSLPRNEVIEEQFSKLIVFDTFIANIDRTLGNIIYDQESHRIWAIDNGYSLGFNITSEWEKRGKEWDYPPMDIHNAKINYPDLIHEYADGEKMEEYAHIVKRRRFQKTEEEFYPTEEMTDEVYSIINYRQEYLARLVWQQGGN